MTDLKLRKLKELSSKIANSIEVDKAILEAFERVDRELFVPQEFRHFAYSLDSLPIAKKQWISSPLTVAKMTKYLQPQPQDSILEIGCGSGYQAAILAELSRRVFTIERIDILLKEANERFALLGYNNIFTKFDDGQRGWKSYAPFDKILFSATAKEVPSVLFEQLKEGGVLVAPVEQSAGQHIITRYEKRGTQIVSQALEPCLFVPILEGKEVRGRQI